MQMFSKYIRQRPLFLIGDPILSLSFGSYCLKRKQRGGDALSNTSDQKQDTMLFEATVPYEAVKLFQFVAPGYV